MLTPPPPRVKFIICCQVTSRGETLTPSQMAALAVAIEELGKPPLFVEPQYEDLSARTISAETGAPVYTLDPAVTGPESDVPLDYYETVMLRNMETLV